MIPSYRLGGSGQDPVSRILWGSAKSFAGVLSLIFVVLATGLIVQRYIDVAALRGAMEGLGRLAPLLAIALFALRAMLFLPLLPVAFLIGMGSLVFGKFYGALYVWTGFSLGACLAFIVARYCVGNLAARLKRGRIRRLEETLSSHGLLSIIGLRLLFFSNVVLNFGSGLTSVTLRDYALGTVIGLAPRAFILSYLFDNLQGPDVVRTLFAYPSLLLLLLAIFATIAGMVLLALLAQQLSKGPHQNP